MYLYSHISIYTYEIVFIRKPISQNNVYFKSYFFAKTESCFRHDKEKEKKKAFTVFYILLTFN